MSRDGESKEPGGERPRTHLAPERWQQMQDLFYAAIELPAAERPRFLAQQCGDDVDLHRRTKGLLEASDKAEGRFEDVIRHTLALAADELGSEVPKKIGSYRVLRELGRGGLSTVYLGERDDDQFRMQVAIKVVRRGMDTEDILNRLRQERQILASLDHPNISRLLDGGTTAEGLPFFVMEYIDGLPIDRFCDRHGLSVVARLDLFRLVCSAVHYAHQNLIIHRDLKPSNILVTREGVPKLLDFGIAKEVRPEPGVESLIRTAPGMRLLSPRYASPEQVLGLPLTTTSDVYSLGVLLFLMLTGQLPYRLNSDHPRELERAICETEPERPSTVIGLPEESTEIARASSDFDSSRMARPPLEPRLLRRRLTGDLDNIVLEAMRKEPERRYGSVEQLSADIRRHCQGLPVRARRATMAYRLQKYLRRHRTGLVVAGVLSLLLAGQLTFFTVRLARERDQAQAAVAYLQSVFESADPHEVGGEPLGPVEMLERGVARLDLELGGKPRVQLQLLSTLQGIYRGMGAYEAAMPLAERALEMARELYGERSRQTADALNAYGALHHEFGHEEEARRLLQRSLDIRRRVLGPNHPKTARNLCSLAAIVRSSDLDLAESQTREALAIQRSQLGDEDIDTVTTLNNLAVIVHDQGRLGEAEKLYRELLTLKQETLSEFHPDIAAAWHNLGSLLVDSGRYDEASEILERALGI